MQLQLSQQISQTGGLISIRLWWWFFCAQKNHDKIILPLEISASACHWGHIKTTKSSNLCWHKDFHHTNLKAYVRSSSSKISVTIRSQMACQNHWQAVASGSYHGSNGPQLPLTWKYMLHSFRGLVVDHMRTPITVTESGIVWLTVIWLLTHALLGI
jgi:hypothetical protein